MKKQKSLKSGNDLAYLASSSLVAISLLAGTTSAVAAVQQDVIEQRQHGFETIDTEIEQLERELKSSDVDWLRVQQLAENSQQISEAMPELFPQGSTDNSRAKNSIWNDWNKFEGLLNQMDQGFTQLYQAAEVGQLSTAQQGLKQAKDTCRSCHRKYRSFW